MSCLCGEVMKTCLLLERLTDRKPISLDCSTQGLIGMLFTLPEISWHMPMRRRRDTCSIPLQSVSQAYALCQAMPGPCDKISAMPKDISPCHNYDCHCVYSQPSFFFSLNLDGGKSLQLLLPVCCVGALHILTHVSKMKGAGDRDCGRVLFLFACVSRCTHRSRLLLPQQPGMIHGP